MDRLTSTFGWLTTPSVTLSESEHRRVHLLALLLLFILLLTIATLILVVIVNPPDSPRRTAYVELISGLILLVVVAYSLNRAGHYYLSAGLTVACSIAGPWGSLLLDSTILSGDIVPLSYVAISILLSSILLPASITIVLAVLQWGALVLLPIITPATAAINWPSFLAFVFFTSVLSILTIIVIQRDLEQIDRQTRQLALSQVQLREQSIRDHLTNLYNRRYLEEVLECEIQRAARKQYALGVIMLDVDNFKTINDTLGHATGDTLLQAIGKFLLGQIRRADI
jgi:hypothetical protein